MELQCQVVRGALPTRRAQGSHPGHPATSSRFSSTAAKSYASIDWRHDVQIHCVSVPGQSTRGARHRWAEQPHRGLPSGGTARQPRFPMQCVAHGGRSYVTSADT
jgi:hypothetical protein